MTLPEPYYRDGLCEIYHGEACELLGRMPVDWFDALVTDPPYSSGGAFRGDRIMAPSVKYVQSDVSREHKATLASFSGDTRSELGHLFWCSAWIARACVSMKSGGVLALFTDWRQLPASVMALQAGGVVWRGIVPWHKPGARPTQGRWTNECEYVIWGTNGPRELEGSTFPGMYSVRSERRKQHIAEKPVGLLRELLRIVPAGGVVLDPFAGSGTTLRAAKDSGVRSVGVEIEERWCEVAARRMSQEVLF